MLDDPITEFEARVLVERDRVLASPGFKQAPVMCRLLTYLVQETLAGRGKRVKAYTVAVDALGRAPDFDPLVDSYPRVQVGRLRKLLETFYARDAGAHRECLFLRRGSYEVGFARIERAYPDLAATAGSQVQPAIRQPPAHKAAYADVRPIEFEVKVPKHLWLALGFAGVGLTSAAVAVTLFLVAGI